MLGGFAVKFLRFSFFYFFDWTSESWEKRGNRVMMAMLIDHHARINSPKKRFLQIRKTFSLAWLNTIIFLMVINHYTYIKLMISLQSPHRPSILEICPSFLEKWGRPPKMANFDDLEIEYDGKKKSIFPNSYWHVLFAKNGVQNGQIWPVWPHLYFTDAYRGFPPCTLSQHPDSRETGYSNVLAMSSTCSKTLWLNW